MRLLLCAVLATAMLCPTLASARERVEIAMVLWRGETEAEKGFREKLAASPDYEVVITAFDAGQNKEKLDRILAGLDPKRFRLAYTFGTMVTRPPCSRPATSRSSSTLCNVRLRAG